MSHSRPDPRWPSYLWPEDVKHWAWRVDDARGGWPVSYPQHAEVAVDGGEIVSTLPRLVSAVSIRCFAPGERVLVLLGDGHPLLRWEAVGKADCLRLDFACPRVLGRIYTREGT